MWLLVVSCDFCLSIACWQWGSGTKFLPDQDRRYYLVLLNFNQKTNLTFKLTLKGVCGRLSWWKKYIRESFVCWRCRHLNVDCSRNYISRDWIGGQKIIPFFFFEMYFLIIFSWQKNTYVASVKTSCLHALCTFDTTTTHIKRITYFKIRVQSTHSGYGNRHYKSRVNFDKVSTILKVSRFTSSAFVFYIPC